jgi:hypothetical protein
VGIPSEGSRGGLCITRASHPKVPTRIGALAQVRAAIEEIEKG